MGAMCAAIAAVAAVGMAVFSVGVVMTLNTLFAFLTPLVGRSVGTGISVLVFASSVAGVIGFTIGVVGYRDE